jgi:SAM-dependent methyltransferase
VSRELPLIPLACPACRAPLEPAQSGSLVCPQDGRVYRQKEGIWRCLLPERSAHYARFLVEYEEIRAAEGRGSDDPAYYRALPFHDLSGRDPAGWKRRGRSFRRFIRWGLIPLERARGAPLAVLDLGAGNAWLSNRLSGRGHRCAALDLRVGKRDGLGAARFYERPLLAVQGEFDRLPFPDGSFDLVVFNASLHYSTSYADTLTEARRVLASHGRLAVVDTPVYHRPASGETMRLERSALFLERYGFASDSLLSENYLTPARLAELEIEAGFTWLVRHPYRGLGWRLRPWLARWRRRRETASFPLILGMPEG